jgi:hypothetical protein
LNFPGPQEGDWVPVIAERKSIYYRPQPFFDRGDTDPLADTPNRLPCVRSGMTLPTPATLNFCNATALTM